MHFKKIKGVRKIPFVKKITQCGDTVFIEKTWCSRLGTKGLIYHQKSGAKTTEKQQKVNDRNAMKRFEMLEVANFKKGDYILTFTFKKGSIGKPLKDYKAECKKAFTDFLRELRKVYKKHGAELKYIKSFEHENCRPHFHMICNSDVNITDFPEWTFGKMKFELRDDRQHQTFGAYLAKENHKKDDINEEMTHKRGEVSSSRNLIRPETKYVVLQSPSWSETPKIPKGYVLDSESLEIGTIENTFTGGVYRYQSYRIIKVKKNE